MESLPQFHSRHSKRLIMLKCLLAGKSMSFDENNASYLTGKLLPRHFPRVINFLGHLVAFMLVVASFPQLVPMFNSFLSSADAEYRFEPEKFMMLPTLFQDLANQGLLVGGERALFLSNKADYDAMCGSSMILFDNVMDHISISDLERQNSIPNNKFDFAFTYEYHDAAARFIDRALKVGGFVAIQLGGENPNDADSFQVPSNYRIAYSRRFDSPVVAIKKIGEVATGPTQTRRRLCGLTSQKKKEALEKLEDVLLEPPRAATGRSSRYLKNTRYLPDLTGDNLEGYPRRMFIDVGPSEKDARADTKWFIENYPTRNLDFHMYKMDTTATNDNQYPSSSPSPTTNQHGLELPRIGISEWLRKNVKEEDFVVMKADADVVEEMVDGQATGLVDELFLECKPKGKKNKANNIDANVSNKRAYWECLALYGRLRDEGVAVHQWWG